MSDQKYYLIGTKFTHEEWRKMMDDWQNRGVPLRPADPEIATVMYGHGKAVWLEEMGPQETLEILIDSMAPNAQDTLQALERKGYVICRKRTEG